MALGFGFNKAKVLASAEKYVQQGKLQNAIAEYEKVSKEEPKDLTVLNTIGDLYSRTGNNDQAVHYFRKVGDAYATQGFTVKAIAMYKKLTKLAPGNVENTQKLAELYTVQGLYNDARAQYVQVADAHLKSGNNDDAAKTFQKILELDPDNVAMQAKLADLYIKLGKKTEARNIYFTAAQSLYNKQAMDAADEALSKVLSLDPKNVDALLLKGAIAAESGDGKGAIDCLKDIPDIDSRPDALRSLLRAQLQLKQFDEAAPIANKLISVHNDLNGVNWLADGYISAGKMADGIQLYEQHADKVLSANGPALIASLSAAVSKVKESSAALESLRNLFRKANETSHEAEIMELLAHAYVTDGNLVKAKDLYHQLAQNEPENPLHQQNYKQVIGMLGEDPAAKPLTAEEAQQPMMVDDSSTTEQGATILHEYDKETAAAVQAALTDAELFDSYNLPAKAIPPLEAGLKKAPRDSQLHARLVQVYVKGGRFLEAARSCNILKEVFAEHGHSGDSQNYAELAAKYLAQAGDAPAPAPVMDMPVADLPPTEAPAFSMPMESAPGVTEFGFSMDTPAAEPPAAEASSVNLINLAQATEAAAPPAAGADDWESMLVVDSDESAAAPSASIEMEVPPPPPVQAPPEISMAVEQPGESVAEFSFESTTDVAPIEMAVEPPPPEPPPPPPPKVVAPPPPPPAPPKPVAPPPPPPPPKVVAPPPPPPPPAPVAAAKAEDMDILGDLVSDLEESLGDLTFGAPAPAPANPVVPTMSAAATAAPAQASMPAPAPVAPESVPAGFSSMGHEIPTEKPEIEHHEAASELSDMFSEFKEDAEASAGEAEDPDTHYNLGIAFKEMGLLDEAIGELQKVCHAVDKGHPFEQSVQAYTWLAQCLVDKGVPQAAIRWYEKALKIPKMNEESRLSVYYDMACAYEMAGEQKKAYQTFMEVYSSNIDYRDVADRIKTLKV